MSELANLLNEGLDDLNIDANKSQKESLTVLTSQLMKWNKTYNLTAIKSEKEALLLHILDSLAVVPFIKQASILDVGTGAGFPGLPLAIMLPHIKFSLVDSNGKKVRFIRQQVHSLNLRNVEVHHSRVENMHSLQYEGIISRAFSSLEDFVRLTSHLLTKNGTWLAMKGHYNPNEINTITSCVEKTDCINLTIPGLSSKRCLIKMRPG